MIDGSLESFGDIYFEGAGHRSLVHLKGGDFDRLTAGVPHAAISGRNR